MKQTDIDNVDAEVTAIIEYFQFERLPVEGTLFKSTYRSMSKQSEGKPVGSAMIGLLCNEPLSICCFHKLQSDEVWHVYGGDPFMLVMLDESGGMQQILMGSQPLKGQNIQYTVPANTWQAAYLISGGRYALYGCTMAPGFRGKDFLAATEQELISKYPAHPEIISMLSITGDETRMPAGYRDD